MTGDDELRRRRKRRALRVPVDEVPRRSAVSGFPPATENAAAASAPFEEIEELEAFEEVTSEVEVVAEETASEEAPSEVAASEHAAFEVPPEAVGVSHDSSAEDDDDERIVEPSMLLDEVEIPSSGQDDADEPLPVEARSEEDLEVDPEVAEVLGAVPASEPPVAEPPATESPEVSAAPASEASEISPTETASPEVVPEPVAPGPAAAVVVVRPMLRVSSLPPPPTEDFDSEEVATYLAPDESDEGLPELEVEPTRVEESGIEEPEETPADAPPAASERESLDELPSEALELTESGESEALDVSAEQPLSLSDSQELPELDEDEPVLTIDDEEEDDDDDAAEELDLEEHGAEELEELPAKAPAPPAAAAAPPSAPEPEKPAPRPEPKPRRRPWFETFFNDDYLRTVRPPKPRDIERECDFITARLNLAPGATILDVGCGLGLHAIELTRRGFLVVGLDLSLPMLSRAGDEAQDHGLKINFLHADMREMNFDGAFDAVLCWGTTFGYFDDESNKRVVERLHRALKPRGVLLLDVVNRDHVIRSQPNLIWFEGDGCICMEESKFNYFLSRLEVKRTVMLDDGRQRDSVYTLRSYALHELGLLLHQQGFRVAEVSGMTATPGVFFGADSPRILIVAERRADKRDEPSRPPPPGMPPE
ncbi:MAG: methyltransferase domain-containing protein [Sandaracinus sp.]|nr:methyltransferase domain-containing protein [Sandaracinus sp.]MCB9635072.1 methyltransferase domain-containing protein [Sandaracinus sp.]